jgi:hypothetical protein
MHAAAPSNFRGLLQFLRLFIQTGLLLFFSLSLSLSLSLSFFLFFPFHRIETGISPKGKREASLAKSTDCPFSPPNYAGIVNPASSKCHLGRDLNYIRCKNVAVRRPFVARRKEGEGRGGWDVIPRAIVMLISTDAGTVGGIFKFALTENASAKTRLSLSLN